MSLPYRTGSVFAETVRLFRRQQVAYKRNLVRRALENYLAYTTQQFQSIYVVALGANAGQLGVANGLGGIVGSVISLGGGWTANKRGTKVVFMFGTILMTSSALIFALASNWWACIPAIVLITCSYYGVDSTICPMICGSCLKTEERATGMQTCDALSAIPRLAAPLVAAFLIMKFGGLSASGIRPIFCLQFIGCCFLAVFVWKMCRDPVTTQGFMKDSHGFFYGVRDIFGRAKKLKAWMMYQSLNDLPYYANPVFWPLYARSMKGANETTIGYMAALMALVPLFLAIPVGRLADSIGRKWIIAAATVLFGFSVLGFITATSQSELLISAFFQGLLQTMVVVRSTMNTERVPTAFLGTWLGISTGFRALVGMTLSPILFGLIWEFIGPSYVYIFMFLLVTFSLAILVTIPDARKDVNSKREASGLGLMSTRM